ncbi:MAG: PEPxxWA-CTERM sorting domain-containing protein [Phenylobacterium sp.]|nr:PEPxxWA-CTERM sorting domain-containing protein [Phenylobacterium sp.]MDP3852265.1 PEPxxWA-CTERM sorting domain-containing protein [Phenylobacterium sp.]
MNKLLVSAAFATAMIFGGATTASADTVTLLTDPCSLESTSCLFDGNTNDAEAIDVAYNGQAPAPVPLLDLSSLLAGEVDASLLDEEHAGTYLAPFLVQYFAVKAADGFMLYKLDTASTSFDWATTGLVNKKGIEHDVSHLAFWGVRGSEVPEPATWAMMIIGFGAVGSMARSSRRKMAVA